jgi:hippurate hydrolase
LLRSDIALQLAQLKNNGVMIINAEAAASNAPKPPVYQEGQRFPPTYNDKVATPKVVDALKGRFGADQVGEIVPASASEDFSWFARAWDVPAVYWALAGAVIP